MRVGGVGEGVTGWESVGEGVRGECGRVGRGRVESGRGGRGVGGDGRGKGMVEEGGSGRGEVGEWGGRGEGGRRGEVGRNCKSCKDTTCDLMLCCLCREKTDQEMELIRLQREMRDSSNRLQTMRTKCSAAENVSMHVQTPTLELPLILPLIQTTHLQGQLRICLSVSCMSRPNILNVK